MLQAHLQRDQSTTTPFTPPVANIAFVAYTEKVPNTSALSKSSRPRSSNGKQAPIRKSDRHETERLYEALRRGNPKLVGAKGETRPLPDTVHSFLVQLTGLLNDGKSVMLVRNQATFTTAEAASVLGVSRQFLVGLLERGEIPYHMVGAHRRMYAQGLFQYKAVRDGRRHQIIRELAQAEAREGLYSRVPSSADGE